MEPPEEPAAPQRDTYYRTPPPPENRAPSYGQLLADSERISFYVEERLRDERREPSESEKKRMARDRWYTPSLIVTRPTGALRRTRLDGRGYFIRRKTWYDHGSRRLEDQIPAILGAFRVLAAEIKIKREQDEQERRQREKAERQRQLAIERRAAHRRLIHELERQAGAWHRARWLRHYVRAARRATTERPVRARYGNEGINFLARAERYLQQLDPLSPTPREPDQEAERSHLHSVDEKKLFATVTRLLGNDWERAAKLLTPSSDETKGEEAMDLDEDD